LALCQLRAQAFGLARLPKPKPDEQQQPQQRGHGGKESKMKACGVHGLMVVEHNAIKLLRKTAMLAKILILATLALILVSLFSALALLFKNDDPSKRQQVVQALTVRIGLSIGLFLVLVASFYFGLIPGRG
jgi:hypothetical protein